MRLVFLGTGAFAVPSLRALRAAGHDIPLVVSQPDRPRGRGLELRPTHVKSAAIELGLPVFQPAKIRLETAPVEEARPDLLVVVAYGQILRANVLALAPRGAVNVHASLLPKYRGAAPIQWAIANGETETGVTTMRLDLGMDTGPMLLRAPCAIEPDDTTLSLEPRLADLGACLLVETISGLAAGTLAATPQDESLATRAPLIAKSDGHVTFDSAESIRNRIRAFTPWPGVAVSFRGRVVQLLEARAGKARGIGAEPGVVCEATRDAIAVACSDGSVLELTRLKPESRAALGAAEFARGARLGAGDRFEPLR